MPLVNWDEKMSVGVAQLDDDHKQLIAMVNELYDSILAEDAGSVLESVLERLVDYTVLHFKREEMLFDAYGYAEAEAHTKEHERLIAQVERIRNSLKGGAVAVVSLEVINYLKHWLVTHIQGMDKKYTEFLNEHGVR